MLKAAFKPAVLRADLLAGLTTAAVTIPDGLADGTPRVERRPTA